RGLTARRAVAVAAKVAPFAFAEAAPHAAEVALERVFETLGPYPASGADSFGVARRFAGRGEEIDRPREAETLGQVPPVLGVITIEGDGSRSRTHTRECRTSGLCAGRGITMWVSC